MLPILLVDHIGQLVYLALLEVIHELPLVVFQNPHQTDTSYKEVGLQSIGDQLHQLLEVTELPDCLYLLCFLNHDQVLLYLLHKELS